jgi:hypothetical protein
MIPKTAVNKKISKLGTVHLIQNILEMSQEYFDSFTKLHEKTLQFADYKTNYFKLEAPKLSSKIKTSSSSFSCKLSH